MKNPTPSFLVDVFHPSSIVDKFHRSNNTASGKLFSSLSDLLELPDCGKRYLTTNCGPSLCLQKVFDRDKTLKDLL
ncbi:hypothetical protein GQ457_17G026730 [Hibiscus cannabinus]